METVLIKAFAFIMIIVLGNVLKHFGFFKVKDFSLISKIVMNITLPCAVISNFNKLQVQTSLLLLVVMGIVCNLIMISIGYFVASRKSPEEKVFNMINFSGYNIGCFTMPYVQSFLGPVGVIATCLFDAGNALLCTGGTYSLTTIVRNTGEKTTIKSFIKNIVSSVALDIYLVMLVLSMMHITLPEVITSFTGTIGAANGFLAMLMIGIGFELNLKRSQISQIIKTIIVRYSMSAVIALFFYFCLPLSLELRQVLVLVIFSPISSAGTFFTKKSGGDLALSSAINSISILMSLTIITVILMFMNII